MSKRNDPKTTEIEEDFVEEMDFSDEEYADEEFDDEYDDDADYDDENDDGYVEVVEIDDESYEEEEEDDDDEGGVQIIEVRDFNPNNPRRARGLRQIEETQPEEEVELPPSKTKVKKQMHELRDLGAEMCDLSKDQLNQLDLPESLRDAIREMQKITSFGAKRRQTQYIGKLMRDIDPAPIIAKMQAWKGFSKQHTNHLHQLERWRDRLLDDSSALTELLALHPQADAQRLRTLIRNAIKEREAGKPPKNYREIFQVLKDIFPEPV